MQRIGLDVPKSALVNNLKDGIEFPAKSASRHHPPKLHPRRTGGGIAYNRES